MSNQIKFSLSVPSWVTLTTGQPVQTIQFYQKLFGWSNEKQVDLTPVHTIQLHHEIPICGIQAPAGSIQPKWRIHIDVADLQETTQKIIVSGGRLLHGPIRIGQAEQTAVFADIYGVEFCINQGRQQYHTIKNSAGNFTWTELITDNVQASYEFYNSVFGWELSEPISGDPSGRRNWLLSDQPIAGLLPRPATMPKEISPYWDVFFSADDPVEIASKVNDLGGKILMPVIEIPHGKIAVFLDATGNVFSVLKAHS